MSKQPFLPMFVGDFLAATVEWEGEERALYALLLMNQWAVGSLPADTKKLAKMIGYTPRNFDVCWPTVSTKFTERDGRLFNERLESHRDKTNEIANKRATAGATGAAKRWQKPQQDDSNQMANGIAIAKILQCHPSHPIPSHPNPSQSNPEKTKSLERASRIPDDWLLTDARKAIAETEHLDPLRTFAKFTDYWRAASGANARKRDWEATWRNWCRNEADRGKHNGHAPRSPPNLNLKTADELETEAIERAMAEGKTDAEIARELDFIPIETIRKHRAQRDHAQH